MAKERNVRPGTMRESGRERPTRGGGATMHGSREQETGRQEQGQQGQQGQQGMTRHERGLLERPLPTSPFSFMRRFTEEMDRLFEDFGFGRSWLSPTMGEMSPSGFSELGRAMWSPQVEVFRRGDDVVVRADLPGMRKEDVRVDVQQDHLVLQGERTWSREDDREGVVRSERHYGNFYRAIPLPDGVLAEQARASYKDGVLEITLPVSEEMTRKRRIEIE